jgi:hypothetical protein
LALMGDLTNRTSLRWRAKSVERDMHDPLAMVREWQTLIGGIGVRHLGVTSPHDRCSCTPGHQLTY